MKIVSFYTTEGILGQKIDPSQIFYENKTNGDGVAWRAKIGCIASSIWRLGVEMTKEMLIHGMASRCIPQRLYFPRLDLRMEMTLSELLGTNEPKVDKLKWTHNTHDGNEKFLQEFETRAILFQSWPVY
jgi:hypothetical protein